MNGFFWRVSVAVLGCGLALTGPAAFATNCEIQYKKLVDEVNAINSEGIAEAAVAGVSASYTVGRIAGWVSIRLISWPISLLVTVFTAGQAYRDYQAVAELEKRAKVYYLYWDAKDAVRNVNAQRSGDYGPHLKAFSVEFARNGISPKWIAQNIVAAMEQGDLCEEVYANVWYVDSHEELYGLIRDRVENLRMATR